MDSKRALATVLFTDIVGSTERAAEMGDRAWRLLLHRFQAVVEEQIRLRHGEVAGTAGDEIVAIFEGPARAILAGCAIRDAVEELGLEVRTGLHMGKVERAGRAIEGIGVHIGARVAALAEPGEVLVSGTLHDAEAGSGFGFEDRGVHSLKGVPGEWRLYAVTATPEVAEPDSGPSPGLQIAGNRRLVMGGVLVLLLVIAGFFLVRDRSALAPDEAIAEAAAPGIAILPFTVNDPELDRWREGMVDLLSTSLDGVGGLRAIDSRRVLSLWQSQVGDSGPADRRAALDVARAAGARYGLIGSVVSSGTDLRLVAEVYDLKGGASLGEARVGGAPDSIFGLIDRLSIALLGHILEEGGSGLPSLDLSGITTASVPALKAFLEGEAAMRRSRFTEAAEAYERAVEADTLFALAYYRLSEAYGWNEGMAALPNEPVLEKAIALRDRLPEREDQFLEVYSAYNESRLEATQLARETARKYPDAPRAWYLLGDALFHYPFHTLATRAEQEEPFERATRLDPGFTPAYIHLLDLAFIYADSARIFSLLDAFERDARGSAFDRSYRLAAALAFADPAGRALVGLDTVSTAVVQRAFRRLDHPRFLQMRAAVLPHLWERPDVPHTEGMWFLRALTALRSGELQEVIELLDEPGIDANGRRAVLSPLWQLESGLFFAIDLPIDPEVYAEAFEVPGPDEPFSGVFVAAQFAIDNGRWQDYEKAVARMRQEIEKARSEGRTRAAVGMSGSIDGLRGYAALARGQRREGIRLLEAAYRRTGGALFKFWTAELLAEEGRTEEALRYLELPEPWMGNLTGSLHEKLGHRDAALEAYGWVVQAWEDADPQLQPQVREAKAAIARLKGLQRG